MCNTPIPHRPRDRPESPGIDFFSYSGGFLRFHYFFSPIVVSYESLVQIPVITNIRGNRLNSAGIAQEFITIRK